jgi:hypothetical protein
MGWQLITMGVGMSVMPGWKFRFFLRMVGWVRIRVIHRVMPVFFLVTLLILAGL